ncbi:winged helix DNA-binding domain-containing protein [Nonomuraea ceibae]|uniref:winged helix DNA-binding domain-containing protein n=1 Tax=Nonomuraea ceibae TaxID=1935170 RepID=UPI0027DEDEE3|nr:winged helix DNA-binding domain-containing protein [Nonomuraea ceibae]
MITLRDLNRATLARQLLLRRHAMPALEAVEHLVGLQAQAPFPPYFGLWSRLSGFEPGELARLLEERHVVRLVLMRGTVHLVSAADSLTLRPLTQPQLTRYLHSAYGSRIAALDLDAVVAAGRRALEGGPLTGAALGARLAGEFPGVKAADLAQIMRILVPLVQVPPRAVWGRSGQTAYATAESWLGRDPDPRPSPETLVRRYLAAFGPATVADAQAWSGLTGLREVVERLRPELVTLTGPDGRELFDLPGAPRPGGEAPAPVRLLAPFDNLLLSHADRTRVIADADRPRVITVNGQVLGTVLVDGFVRGTWKRDKAVVSVELFAPVTGAQAEEIRAEAAALLAFAAPGSAHDIRGV